MKRLSEKIARLILICCFAGATLVACDDTDEEVFENVNLQKENATDETNEVKQKPK